MQKTLLSDLTINNGKLDGFFRGVVENNVYDGPDERKGQCKIRIFGVHSADKIQDDKGGIPTEHLPWAQQITGLGGNATSSVPKIGAYVFCFFENGNPSQPRYFGVAPGTEKGNPDVVKPDESSFTPEGGAPVEPPNPLPSKDSKFIAYLNRTLSNNEGTRGTLTIKDDQDMIVFSCKTLELPWRNNMSGKSCFPKGTYSCAYTSSGKPSLTKTYIINGTPGRAGCRFHGWNWGGNKDLGFRADIEGCVLLGDSLIENAPNGRGKNQVRCDNGSAVRNLPIKLNQQPFTLVVTGVVG